MLAVLAITGGKDGYEDVKRHQSDKRVNHSVSHILSGGNYLNHNAMAPKAKTFVKGVSLPQSKAKREAKRKEEAGWGQIVRDENTAEVEHDEAFPGEDVRAIRTREDEREAGEIPSSAAQDKEAGENEADGELGWRRTMWEDVKVGDFIKIYNNEGLPAGKFELRASVSRGRRNARRLSSPLHSSFFYLRFFFARFRRRHLLYLRGRGRRLYRDKEPRRRDQPKVATRCP